MDHTMSSGGSTHALPSSSSLRPRHGPDESILVFDTHPCASADTAAQRVYGPPVVCTTEEYSDTYTAAAIQFNHPTCILCMAQPPRHVDFMQKLRAQYPHLDLQLASHVRGCRYVLVLSIRRHDAVAAVVVAGPDPSVPSGLPLPPAIPAPVLAQVMPERILTKQDGL